MFISQFNLRFNDFTQVVVNIQKNQKSCCRLSYYVMFVIQNPRMKKRNKYIAVCRHIKIYNIFYELYYSCKLPHW